MGIPFTLVEPEGFRFLGSLGFGLDIAHIIAIAAALGLSGASGQEKGENTPQEFPPSLVLLR